MVNGYKEICGVVHFHTKFSDGSSSYEDLIRESRKAGLDFIAPTDHKTLEPLYRGFGGFHNGLFVLVGYEHNDKNNNNHLISFNVNRVSESCKPEQYVADIKKQGGVAFIAHPEETRDYFTQFPPYPWTEWEVEGYDGVEIRNQFSEWMENLKGKFYYLKVFFPRRFLKGPPQTLINRWDVMNKERFVPGIGSVDGHTIPFKKGPFTFYIFPLRVELKCIRSHYYVGEWDTSMSSESASIKLLTAMKNGNGFISNYRWGDARGSNIYMTDSDNRMYLPGRVEGRKYLPGTLNVNLKLGADIKVFKNGKVVHTKRASKIRYKINTPGSYRVEALRKGRTWIISNHFPVGEFPFRG